MNQSQFPGPFSFGGKPRVQPRVQKVIPQPPMELFRIAESLRYLVKLQPSQTEKIIGTVEGWMPALVYVEANKTTHEAKVIGVQPFFPDSMKEGPEEGKGSGVPQ
jgi:hypothetical protein